MVFSKNNTTYRQRQTTNNSHNSQGNKIDHIKQNLQKQQLSMLIRERNNHCSYCR